MYFTTQIEIDSSQIFVIRRSQKEHFLCKLLDVVSSVQDKHLAQETFTASQVSNQIQGCLSKLNVDNFYNYNDLVEQEKDITIAVDYLSKKLDDLESDDLSSIELSLEHDDDLFKYYLLISVNRKYAVGGYPKKITVNALFEEYNFDESIQISVFENHSFKASQTTILNPNEKINVREFEGKMVFGANNYPELFELVEYLEFNKIEE